MAGPGGMKDAVEERQAKQPPDRAAVCLRSTDHSRNLTIEFRLLRKHPADKPAARKLRALRTWRAERLRRSFIDQARGRERTLDQNPIGELRAVIHRVGLTGLCVRQDLRTLCAWVFRPVDFEFALLRRAGKRDRIFLRKTEVDRSEEHTSELQSHSDL